ncbi:ATP-dependent helicase/nuclease subunit A [Shimia sp. SK013]|uniref:double-strand break repair helicase AddA n=1 Tax=Shimia sp. SK013 TaxID=1389006 RepID=UPI0006B68BB3|nr:double-strand break repair helicase AddA [Shimia sp. SK013]KPA19856.1 ATP-dependent helicase/nuclease subunit A [Shimia sp. SK013]
MTQVNDATRQQIIAARPDASTWLSANAGSGKTRVLTDRVARLLLQGVMPQHILCLTYTKAAASEMQNRLFDRLGSWAMKSDAALTDELAELGASTQAGPKDLSEARTLFARAIETPGGLKIQTIHSFCASLLRRFPLEAGVSPLFTEMETRAAALLREEIVEDMARGNQAPLIEALAFHFTGQDLEDLTGEITRKADLFRTPKSYGELCEIFELPTNFDASSVLSSVFLGGEEELINSLISLLRTGSSTDIKAADKLQTITTYDPAAIATMEGVFLTGASAKEPFSAKLGSFPTKKLQAANPDLIEKLQPLMLRVEAARENRIALAAVERSAALHGFAHAFVQHYEHQKQQRGWLDFDDLILRARSLLNEPAVAEWVLYRLDGGIDHILVDEAQDTSPAQWQVIERLAQEFTSGTGARSDITRTIFVVGDKKQSIYSFQGADPAEFDRMRGEFSDRLEPSGHALQNLSLEYSFRSSPAILNLVDVTFQNREYAGFPDGNRHIAFHDQMPGRVDLWPVVDPTPKPEKDDWFDPVDRRADTHHTVILAQRLAREIRRMIDTGATIAATKGTNDIFTQRPVREGDFLVLVQRRSDLFHEIIRACKTEGLAIAGADRLKVGAEMAVRDLGALLSFLATPEDDLSLATILRSPLFGWSEQALFDLAHRRIPKQHLWEALRKRRDEFPDTLAILDDLRKQADFLRPYDLIERVLTRHEGRRKLLSRLGGEAEDGINALLSQALAYEKSSVPSLTGFLQWMETDDLEIKRQMDSASNRIRVMTVHGSKGLEAPIVIMPDTGRRITRTDTPIVNVDDIALWNVSKDVSPSRLNAARDQMAEKLEAERLRLLYVAMTRAEKWLIVAAAGELGKDGKSWYDTVDAAMQKSGAVPNPMPGGEGLRIDHGDWSGPVTHPKTDTETTETHLPDILTTDAPAPRPTKIALSPSNLGGAKALPGDAGLDEEAALRRGSQIHLLLEHFPDHDPEKWSGVAKTLLQNDLAPSGPADFESLLTEAKGVLRAADLSWLFDGQTLAEVPLTATLGQHRLHGIIDRLVVTSDSVLAVDFKTNATVPVAPSHAPEGLLRQMGAYAHGLAQIYPNHRIETGILWTRSATYMPLPHDLVTKALATTGYLDAAGPQT